MDSGKHASTQRPSVIRSFLSFVLLVVFVFVLSWALRTYVFGTYEIPSGSMLNTIQIGDRVVAEKISYYSREPEAGEIVTFQDPETPSRTLIKRCIAVGGQTVDLQDGKVVVDGVVLDEPYTEGKPSDDLRSPVVTFPYTVPEGYIWVMGDNRTNSQDSRWFGAIPVETVTGHAVLTYWPVDSVGMLN